MKKYKILFDGEFEDEVFDSEEAAGDYPLDDFYEPEYEIVEVDE
jgi:hypothetical protein